MKNKLIENIQSVLCHPEHFDTDTHTWIKNCFNNHLFNAEDLEVILNQVVNVKGYEKAKTSLQYELFLLEYQEEETEPLPTCETDYENYFIQFKL